MFPIDINRWHMVLQVFCMVNKIIFLSFLYVYLFNIIITSITNSKRIYFIKYSSTSLLVLMNCGFIRHIIEEWVKKPPKFQQSYNSCQERGPEKFPFPYFHREIQFKSIFWKSYCVNGKRFWLHSFWITPASFIHFQTKLNLIQKKAYFYK